MDKGGLQRRLRQNLVGPLQPGASSSSCSGRPLSGWGYYPLQEPRIERPPFFDATTLTVETGDLCQHLREWSDAEAASLACIPGGNGCGVSEAPSHWG
jgi:hypothetical protein